MKIKHFLFFFCFVFFIPQIYAQTFTIKGSVKDNDGDGLTDASIINKRSGVKTICNDYEGRYTIEANRGDTLEFSCEFYVTQHIVVRKSEYNIILQMDTSYVREPFVRPYRRNEVREQVENIELDVQGESQPLIEEAVVPQHTQITYVVDGEKIDRNWPSDFKMSSIKSITVIKDSIYESVSEAINVPMIIDITTAPGYDVIVMEPGYDTFLITQPSKESYSESSLKTKNIRMVNEWNTRCKNPAQYDPNIYEMEIDYNPLLDYGIDAEHKIFMFFRFVSDKFGLRLD